MYDAPNKHCIAQIFRLKRTSHLLRLNCLEVQGKIITFNEFAFDFIYNNYKHNKTEFTASALSLRVCSSVVMFFSRFWGCRKDSLNTRMFIFVFTATKLLKCQNVYAKSLESKETCSGTGTDPCQKKQS